MCSGEVGWQREAPPLGILVVVRVTDPHMPGFHSGTTGLYPYGLVVGPTIRKTYVVAGRYGIFSSG